MDENKWQDVFKMLKMQDTNSTTCKTCKRLIKYSIKDPSHQNISIKDNTLQNVYKDTIK